MPAQLLVDPYHRNSGAGRSLMEVELHYARTQELALEFDVMVEDQLAIRLYKCLGANSTQQYGINQSEPDTVCVTDPITGVVGRSNKNAGPPIGAAMENDAGAGAARLQTASARRMYIRKNRAVRFSPLSPFEQHRATAHARNCLRQPY